METVCRGFLDTKWIGPPTIPLQVHNDSPIRLIHFVGTRGFPIWCCIRPLREASFSPLERCNGVGAWWIQGSKARNSKTPQRRKQYVIYFGVLARAARYRQAVAPHN